MKKIFYLYGLLFVLLFTYQITNAQLLINTDTINVATQKDAIDLVFGLLPKIHFENGVLIEKSGYDYHFKEVEGNLTDSTINALSWYFFYEKLRFSASDSILNYRFTKLDSIKNAFIDANNILPFGVLDFNYFRFADSSIIDGSITANNYRLVENTSDLTKIYKKEKLFCVSPLNEQVNTLNPQFIILPNMVFSNNTNSLSKIIVNCDDNLGFHEILINQVFQANYNSGGYKNIITYFIFSNGDTLKSNSSLYCSDPNILSKVAYNYEHYTEEFDVLSWSDTYPDEFGSGLPYKFKKAKCGVWFGCNIENNSTRSIRKPIIIFAGYNPKDGKDLSGNGNAAWINDYLGAIVPLAGWRGPLFETYNGFFVDASIGPNKFGSNGSELFNKLRTEGYDIIIVQMEDGVGYMQYYAHMVTQVIKRVNTLKKVGYNALNPDAGLNPEAAGYPNSTLLRRPHHENIVMGYSAGALSSRMGLLLMEYQHNKYKNTADAWKYPHHNTRIWAAYDCENQGSNTSIGFQMMLDFLANPNQPIISFADVAHTLLASTALGVVKTNGVATQNSLYHINQLFRNNASNSTVGLWDASYDQDFLGYFQDLNNLSPNNPPNLKGYPLYVRRIAISQGNANGLQNSIADKEMIQYNVMTNPCYSPAGGAFNLNPLINPLAFSPLQVRGFRNATSYYIMQPGTQSALYCRNGLSIKTLFWSWHINYGHSKYDIFNNIINAQEYDVTAASTLPAMQLFGNKLIYGSKDLTTASFLYCIHSPFNSKYAGFSPTVSGLDIHTSGNNTLPRLPNLSLSPYNQNLLFQNNYGNPNKEVSPHHNFGYPHIKNPTNHYDITPFDAVCANGDFDNTLYEANTIHVEDPNPYNAEFLVEELAPTTLYLSNRTIQDETTGEKYYADFEARNSVLAGNQEIYKHGGSIDPNDWYQRLQTPAGDFVIENNAVVTMRANNADGQSAVTLGAGFSAKAGCIFRAYVTRNNYCSPFHYRLASSTNTNSPNVAPPARNILTKTTKENQEIIANNKVSVTLYPNPTMGSIYYDIKPENSYTYSVADITGRVIEEGMLSEQNNVVSLNAYNAGIYLITITNKQHTQTDKILLQ